MLMNAVAAGVAAGKVTPQIKDCQKWRKPMFEVILRRFDNPDEVRLFEKGRFEIVKIGG